MNTGEIISCLCKFHLFSCYENSFFSSNSLLNDCCFKYEGYILPITFCQATSSWNYFIFYNRVDFLELSWLRLSSVNNCDFVYSFIILIPLMCLYYLIALASNSWPILNIVEIKDIHIVFLTLMEKSSVFPYKTWCLLLGQIWYYHTKICIILLENI